MLEYPVKLTIIFQLDKFCINIFKFHKPIIETFMGALNLYGQYLR